MSSAGGHKRLTRHRARVAAAGGQRVEVTVPRDDVRLVKAVASALRGGDEEAARIRAALEPILASPKAQTGAELVAFLRSSPLVGAELEPERDPSAGRAAELA